MKPVTKAFLVAPIAPFLIYLIVAPSIFAAATLIGAPIAYLIALLWGIPLYSLIQQRSNLQKGWLCALLTGILGGVVGAIISLFFDVHGFNFTLTISAIGMFHGASSGYIFWLIAQSKSSDTLVKSNA